MDWALACGHDVCGQSVIDTTHATTTCEQNTFSHCMYRRRHFVSTLHMMSHAHAWLRLKLCLPQNSYSISCAMSHALHSTPSILSSFHFPLLSPSFTGSGSRLITSRIHWADSRDLRGDGFTDPEPSTQHEDDDAECNRARTW